MMLRRMSLLVLVVAFATGCSSFSNMFKNEKKAAKEPAPLVRIGAPISVQKLWSVSLGGGEGMLGLRQKPALDAARLYAVDDSGSVHAIDRLTGRNVWETSVVTSEARRSWKLWKRQERTTGLTSGPAAANGMVVVGGRNGEVIALDADSGQVRWTKKVSSAVIAAPLITADRVIVRSNDGRVFGLDPADGSRKWVFDRGLPTLSVRGNSSPVLGQGITYIGYDDGSIIALRVEDGLRVWEQIVAEPDGRTELDRMADIDGEIQVGADEVVATSYHGTTMSIRNNNGAPLWSREIGSHAGIAMLADKIVLADKAGNVWALDRNTGADIWKQDAMQRRWLTTPAIQGNYAVLGDLEGYLHWLRLDDGQIVGRIRLEKGIIRGTPLVSDDGVLYALSTDGKLAAYTLGQ